MIGMGEKKTQNEKDETKGKYFPRLVALPSPRLRNGGRLFSGVRKQAEPTLGGTGALV